MISTEEHFHLLFPLWPVDEESKSTSVGTWQLDEVNPPTETKHLFNKKSTSGTSLVTKKIPALISTVTTLHRYLCWSKHKYLIGHKVIFDFNNKYQIPIYNCTCGLSSFSVMVCIEALWVTTHFSLPCPQAPVLLLIVFI